MDSAESFKLGEHFDRFVNDLLARGRFSSAGDVVKEGLKLLEAREQADRVKIDRLREAIAEGLASGPAEPLDIEAVIMAARQRRDAL